MLLIGERQKGETHKAVIACNDYLRMGPGRSLEKLVKKYRSASEWEVERVQKPPTKRLSTLFKWSALYGWVERSRQYDEKIEQEKTDYATQMMKEGLAADYERVAKLKGLFELLFDQLMETGDDGVLHNLWLPDVKQIGSGEDAEKVEIERYNSPLISDIRGILDDLAKETGGRKQKAEIDIPKAIEIVMKGNIDPDQL